MRLIIAGSRWGVTYQDLLDALELCKLQDLAFQQSITQVICGGAQGADLLGKRWAENNSIPVRDLPADWDDLNAPGAIIMTRPDGKRYNAKAGHDRNQLMVDIAHAALFVRKSGKSTGTDDCIKRCKKKGIPYYVHQL